MSIKVPEDMISRVRRFNRFYTQKIGVLKDGLLGGGYSLTQVRVLYEIVNHGPLTATDLGQSLGLDAGYVSRILGGFKKDRLIKKTKSSLDGRQYGISITEKGKREFQPLDKCAGKEIEKLLKPLSEGQRRRLIEACDEIQQALGDGAKAHEPYLLRPHQPGDMGWVVERHGAIYAEEYHWNERFESLVAKIISKFLDNYDSRYERCWIAEMERQRVGSVFLVKKTKTIAQLRLLFVDPKARGSGIGRRLVDECIHFARTVGFRKIVLWTNDVLLAARHIYEKAGFQLVKEERHHSFGHDLTGQYWELKL